MLISSFFIQLLLIIEIFTKNIPIPRITEHVSQPIVDLVDVMFVQKNIHFDIIIYGVQTEYLRDVIDEVQSKSAGKYAEKIRTIDPTRWNHVLNKSAVIFMPHLKLLMQLNRHTKLIGDYYSPLKFLIYCEYLKVHQLQLIQKSTYLTNSPGHISNYQYFLLDAVDGYNLVTFEWYTKQVCNVPNIVYTNFYNEHIKKWNVNLKIENKYRNFHGCMLTIGVVHNFMYMFVDIFGELHGPAIVTFKAMSEKGNFMFNYQMIERLIVNNELVYKGIPKDGIIMDIQLFLQIPFIALSNTSEALHFSTLFVEEKAAFGLTEPEEYSSFEKLLFPFDTITWIFLLVVFFSTFLTIFFVNLRSIKKQRLIFGINIKTPALNVISTFFGISQSKIPFRNFPRMILMTFVLFCLVIRTAYQGVLFEMVATNIRKPLPKTIEDLYKMNYTIYTYDVLLQALKYMIPHEQLPIFRELDRESFSIRFINIKNESGNRIAFCESNNFIQLYRKHFDGIGGVLNETLYSALSGFLISQYHFLYEFIDQTVQDLITGGILQHSLKELELSTHADLYSLQRYSIIDSAKKCLTFDDLSYGFELWMIALAISLMVFLLEMTSIVFFRK